MGTAISLVGASKRTHPPTPFSSHWVLTPPSFRDLRIDPTSSKECLHLEVATFSRDDKCNGKDVGHVMQMKRKNACGSNSLRKPLRTNIRKKCQQHLQENASVYGQHIQCGLKKKIQTCGSGVCKIGWVFLFRH